MLTATLNGDVYLSEASYTADYVEASANNLVEPPLFVAAINPSAEQIALQLPSGLPDRLTTQVTIREENLTLVLEKTSVLGPNTRVLVENEQGNLEELNLGADGSYAGTVAGSPEYLVSAWLSDRGLTAQITRPGRTTVVIDPTGDGTTHHIWESEVVVASHDHDGDGIEDHVPEDHPDGTGGGHPPGCRCAACCGVQASTGPIDVAAAAPTRALSDEATEVVPFSAAATVPPSRVLDVLEFEVGVEVGSAALLNNYAGSTTQQKVASAMVEVQKIPNNLDARYLHATGIKHRLGTIIIRTGSDPFSVANGNDGAGLNAFRDYWNNNPQEVGDTHDLAVYHVRASPSGLAFVNSVGGANRYALSASNGPSSWADGTLVHEFGHSWNLLHVNDSIAGRGYFYESKPRNNGGSNTAGGEDVFVSIMDGRGQHNIGRLATDEANEVFAARESRRQFGDLIDPGPVKPFGHRDQVFTASQPIVIDVIANDYDVNNDVLDAQLLDTVSQQGGTISLSVGTGPGGRNEIVYTPPTGSAGGTDFFHYTVIDSTGRTDWGAVYVTVTPDFDLAYQFDFGPDAGPVYAGENAPGGFGAANTAWNLVTDTNATLANVPDASGAASQVGIKVREAADGGDFDFASPASGLQTRDAGYTGFYGTDLLSHLMFTNGDDDLGIEVTGLSPGVYAVYTILREPSAAGRTYTVDIGAGSTTSPSVGDFGLGNTTGTPASAPNSWVQNQNYYTEVVSVFEGDSLYVLIDSLDSDFVSLQGLQLARIGDVAPPPLNVYQIDFGPIDDGTSTGAIGPAAVPGNYSTWNGYDHGTNELTGLLDGRGSQNLDIRVRVREAADGQAFDFDADVSGLESRDGGYTGFYGTQLLSDLIFSRNDDDLGVQVEGLAPGEYDVFLIAREPDSGAGQGSTRTYTVDIGTSDASSVAVGDFGLGNATANPASAPEAWIENQNYYTERVTVLPGESLYVLTDSVNSDFGLLQGLQIIQRTLIDTTPQLPLLLGDYNTDGRVDAADYTVWRDQVNELVEAYSGADGNGDGVINDSDRAVWAANYGAAVITTTLLDETTGNGSFEDWGSQNGASLLIAANGSLSIPGWTADTVANAGWIDESSGAATLGSASHGDRNAIAAGGATLTLTSDPILVHTVAAGDLFTVAFDASSEDGTANLYQAFLVFDGVEKEIGLVSEDAEAETEGSVTHEFTYNASQEDAGSTLAIKFVITAGSSFTQAFLDQVRVDVTA